MAMSDPLEVITIVAASMVKFAISPLVSYGLGYTFLQTLLFTSLGGCLGVVVFYRISAWLMNPSPEPRTMLTRPSKMMPSHCCAAILGFNSEDMAYWELSGRDYLGRVLAASHQWLNWG